MTFHVVHSDSCLIVVDKPSGLLCQPGRGPDKQDCLLSRLSQQWPAALIVHRLDRDTSGLMVLALDAQTHRQLSRQFELRVVQKEYVAFAYGQVEGDAGQIDLPLRKDLDHSPRHIVDQVLGKSATTLWTVLERFADRTRLLLTPLTGRSHQLRIHLAHIGHPILGDPLYAHSAALAMASRLQLHATQLSLTHPAADRLVTWTSSCPF